MDFSAMRNRDKAFDCEIPLRFQLEFIANSLRIYLISFIIFYFKLVAPNILPNLITIKSIFFQSISKFMRYLLGSSIVSLVSCTCTRTVRVRIYKKQQMRNPYITPLHQLYFVELTIVLYCTRTCILTMQNLLKFHTTSTKRYSLIALLARLVSSTVISYPRIVPSKIIKILEFKTLTLSRSSFLFYESTHLHREIACSLVCFFESCHSCARECTIVSSGYKVVSALHVVSTHSFTFI